MRTKKNIGLVETHTEGHPTRSILYGFPPIPGNSMQDKLQYMKDNADWLRTMICYEPRGCKFMTGAIMTRPTSENADIGALFFESGGWYAVSGHDAMGFCTALVEEGLIAVKEPETLIRLDTAAGILTCRVRVENGKAKAVTISGLPSFVMAQNVTVKTEEWGDVTMDISWGGNAFAILPAEAVGLEILPANFDAFEKATPILRGYINEQIKLDFPVFAASHSVTHIQYTGPAKNPEAIGRNVVVCRGDFCDRSPSGAGTAARAALLHAQGKLAVGESFVHESMIGTTLTCKCTGEAEVGGTKAIQTEITGRAWVDVLTTFYIDPRDPFPHGFRLG